MDLPLLKAEPFHCHFLITQEISKTIKRIFPRRQHLPHHSETQIKDIAHGGTSPNLIAVYTELSPPLSVQPALTDLTPPPLPEIATEANGSARGARVVSRVLDIACINFLSSEAGHCLSHQRPHTLSNLPRWTNPSLTLPSHSPPKGLYLWLGMGMMLLLST